MVLRIGASGSVELGRDSGRACLLSMVILRHGGLCITSVWENHACTHEHERLVKTKGSSPK